MSKKGERWTQALAAEAAAQQKYIKLGDKGGFLKITGAKQKWAKDPSYVYIPQLRVAGSQADVRRVLLALGNSPAQVDGYIASGYTKVGAEGPMKTAFEAEVAVVRGPSKARKPRSPSRVKLDDLDYFSNLKNMSKEPRKKVTKKKKKAAKKKKRGKSPASKKREAAKKKAESQKKKFEALRTAAKNAKDKGMVVDISALKVDGTGRKTVKMSKKMTAVPGYPGIVSTTKSGVTKFEKLGNKTGLATKWGEKKVKAVKSSSKRGSRSKRKSKSPKRKSKSKSKRKSKSKSPKRKTAKRKSKSKSPKRKSPKRKSPKRKSPKRKSPKRKSPKRKSKSPRSSRKSPRLSPPASPVAMSPLASSPLGVSSPLPTAAALSPLPAANLPGSFPTLSARSPLASP